MSFPITLFLFPITLIHINHQPSLPHLPDWLGFLINWLGKHLTHCVLILPSGMHILKEHPLPPVIESRHYASVLLFQDISVSFRKWMRWKFPNQYALVTLILTVHWHNNLLLLKIMNWDNNWIPPFLTTDVEGLTC